MSAPRTPFGDAFPQLELVTNTASGEREEARNLAAK